MHAGDYRLGARLRRRGRSRPRGNVSTQEDEYGPVLASVLDMGAAVLRR